MLKNIFVKEQGSNWLFQSEREPWYNRN